MAKGICLLDKIFLFIQEKFRTSKSFWKQLPLKYGFTHGLCFVCFVSLRPKSTAMVIAEWSVHLTALFSWASLNKQLTTSNRAHTFACNWQQPFMNDSAEGRRMTARVDNASTIYSYIAYDNTQPSVSVLTNVQRYLSVSPGYNKFMNEKYLDD